MKTPLVSVLKIGHKDTDGYDIVLKPVSRDSEGRVFSPFFLGPVSLPSCVRVPPRPSDLRAALDGRSIHIEYDSCGGLRAKNAAECAERPNTTDMFRMFRDNHNKPKRGRK